MKFTLPEMLIESVNNFSNLVALADLGSMPLTYKQLKENVDSVSQFLKDENIVKGDRVAILSENQVNWSIAYFAITSIGAVAVPIMTEFHESEVHHVIRHSGSKAIFVSAKFYDKIEDTKFEDLQTRILIEDFSIIPPYTKHDFVKEVLAGGKKEFEKIKMAALKLVGAISEEVEEDDLAIILYTSGTTGHSKGVMLTHKNIVFDAHATSKLVELSPDDKLLSILPLFHTIESTLGLVTVIMAGASVYYLKKPPTASVLLPALKKVKPTIIISVPLVIEKIYKMKILPEINKKAIVRSLYKLSPVRKKINKIAGKKLIDTFGGKLRMLSIGGASLSADVEKFLREAKFPYAIGYGLTETAPLVTGSSPDKVRMRSAGYTLTGMEIKIDNPDPENGEGEILIKGPNVMQGYFKDPEKTEEVLTEGGWFRSGDLGVLDEDGYLFIKGRSKNVIIGPNGKNIYPEEIESIINEQKYVLESLVLDRENKLIAKVFLNYDLIDEEYQIQKLNEPESRKIINTIIKSIHTHINGKVSTFSKVSEVFEQTEPFEKTPTQKIKRYLYV